MRTVPTRLAPRGGVCVCVCGCSPARARGPPLPATPLRLLRADWGVPPAVLEVPTELRGEPSAARLSPGQG